MTNWYIVKMVFRIICGDGNHTAQFDEQIRMIHAEDELDAFQKARRLGEREQDNFLNAVNKPVQWKFIDVCEVHKLNSLVDGAEMYSKIREEDSADIYIRATHLKAKLLFEASVCECIKLN